MHKLNLLRCLQKTLERSSHISGGWGLALLARCLLISMQNGGSSLLQMGVSLLQKAASCKTYHPVVCPQTSYLS